MDISHSFGWIQWVCLLHLARVDDSSNDRGGQKNWVNSLKYPKCDMLQKFKIIRHAFSPHNKSDNNILHYCILTNVTYHKKHLYLLNSACNTNLFFRIKAPVMAINIIASTNSPTLALSN